MSLMSHKVPMNPTRRSFPSLADRLSCQAPLNNDRQDLPTHRSYGSGKL